MLRLSTLAPAGGFPSPWQLASTSRLYRLYSPSPSSAVDQLRLVLAALASGQSGVPYEALLYGSGKAALTSLLSALRGKTDRDVLLMPAYTCPDVAACALRVGFKPYLADLEPQTLRLRTHKIPEAVLDHAAGVVVTNLYGIPDSLIEWQRLQEKDPKFFIVDDACQAFQSMQAGRRVGARKNVYGVLSFGRGKSFCASGGGAVLLPRSGEAELLAILERLAPKTETDGNVRTHVVGFAAWLLERPFLYTLPASVPGLGLGETKCKLDFPVGGICEAQALAALSLAGSFERGAGASQQKMLRYESALGALSGLSLPSLVCRMEGIEIMADLLRFPVVLDDPADRTRILERLRKEGLGANASYPKDLASFHEFDGKLTFGDIEGARSLADRVVTLPLHRYVTKRLQDRITDIISGVLQPRA